MFEALEANDLSAWPRGLYARAWVRTYACAVGLDPIDTVDEFCRLFPQGDRRGHVTMHDIAASSPRPPSSRTSFRTRSGGANPTVAPWPRRRSGGIAPSSARPRAAGDLLSGFTRHVKTRAA